MMSLTAQQPSPENFRRWAAIHAVGAAAERRVWTNDEPRTFTNLYVFLVSPPGVGKGVAINPITSLLRKAGCCQLAPNDISKQGFLDALAATTHGAIIDGSPIDFSYMAIYVRDMVNFMPKFDEQLAGLLTDLWDCPDINEESKRHGLGKTIPFPGVSLLLGAATDTLNAAIPNIMWGSGFMARTILVYEDQKIKRPDIFRTSKLDPELSAEIVSDLKKLAQFKGPMRWTPEAMALAQEFHDSMDSSAVDHTRMAHYNVRRDVQVLKLSQIAALSDLRMVVHEGDVDQALKWLLPTEAKIPALFASMAGHEDGALLEEVVHTYHDRTFRNPITQRELWGFFSKRAGAGRVAQLIEVAMNADYLARVAGTSGEGSLYIPLRGKRG